MTTEKKGFLARHQQLERNVTLLAVFAFIAVIFGGIIEIAPLFWIDNTIEKVQGVRPYTPLEQAGRDIYIREGCYLCHSQMIRPFRDEVERYGHYSLAAESMYDHPFQWGSKRTGPDLARVGGRYSVWSAIGLPVALAIGADDFKRLLAGARAMDEHFSTAPTLQNIPVLMALLGVWNRNFLKAPSHHIATYAYRLRGLTPYIQQLDMESNGKGTHLNASRVQVETAPIVWGGLGIDGQHAYFQLIHQGEHLVPVDFIGIRQDQNCPMPLTQEHLRCLHLNMMAQAQAMALGRDESHTRSEMQAQGLSPEAIDALAPHRSFKGNTPSSSLWLQELDAFNLGMLMALYEHKTFVQASIWGINPFDQWGVELGKTMANELARHPDDHA